MIACAVGAFWALASGASAQVTEFFACPWRDGASCIQLNGGQTILAQCSTDPPTENIFVSFFGPLAWYPLRCVGPITVGVETFCPPDTRFPLYVEVVPLHDPATFPWTCENIPGTLIMIVYGQSAISAPCGTWDEAGPLDITSVVPLGSLYALRLYLFTNLEGNSPYLGCVHLTAQPVDSTPVAPITWGNVKELYR